MQTQTVSRTRPLRAVDDLGPLMTAGQAGDAQAYHLLLSEAGTWLRRYYARRLPAGLIDDAVQDVLVVVHANRHAYSEGRPFRPWLGGIAHHKWVDRVRSMRVRATQPLPDEIAGEGDHEASVTSAIVLNRLLAGLKPAQAKAIRLVKLQGLSIEEAASETRQSRSLVKINIHRGLRRMSATVQACEICADPHDS